MNNNKIIFKNKKIKFKAEDHSSLIVFLIQCFGVLLRKTFLIHCPILSTAICFYPLIIGVTFLWRNYNLLNINNNLFHFIAPVYKALSQILLPLQCNQNSSFHNNPVRHRCFSLIYKTIARKGHDLSGITKLRYMQPG